MQRLKTLCKVIIFLGLGLFLATRLLNQTLNYYIHPRFNTLIVFTAAGFIIVGILYVRQHIQTILFNQDTHKRHHDHQLSWLGLGILALPVVLGFMIQPRPLGVEALQNRNTEVGAITSAQAPKDVALTSIIKPGDRHILDWLYLFQRTPNLGDIEGQEVNVDGFVYQDERFGPEEFMVSRFTLSCCVADATPIGLIVQWSETNQLATAEWVSVAGVFQVSNFNGQEVPVVIAEKVAPAEAPSQPYLYR